MTHKILVNGANEIFQGSNKSPNSLEVGWILFNYPYSNQISKMKKCTFVNMNYIVHGHQCIEYMRIDVQIDLNSIHTITRSQFFCSINYNIYHTFNAKINT